MRKLEENPEQLFVIKLNQHDLETIIAGLRMLECESCDDRTSEIDALCEKINCSDPLGVEVTSVEDIIKDPSTPYWALNVIHEAAKKDPVDAANTLEVIAQAFSERCRAWIAKQHVVVGNLYDKAAR